MKTVRFMCFETNSSSVHSLIIRNKKETTWISPDQIRNIARHNGGVIPVTPGEYGWSGPIVDNFKKKLSYIMTMIFENFKYDRKTETFRSADEVLELGKESKDWREVCDEVLIYAGVELLPVISNTDFYIDHQSAFLEIHDFLGDMALPQYLFDENVGVYISNDNLYEEDEKRIEKEMKKGRWKYY